MFLKGFMKVRSSGCNLFDVCGGMLSIWTWFSRAKVITSYSLWLPWPSIINSTGSCAVGFTICMNALIQLKNIPPFIHPLGWAWNVLPAGAPIFKRSLIYARGKMKSGSMKWSPAALMQKRSVIVLPLSAEVIFPTCLLPFVLKTLNVFLCTQLTPVSSALYMRDGEKLYWFLIWFHFSKNR